MENQDSFRVASEEENQETKIRKFRVGFRKRKTKKPRFLVQWAFRRTKTQRFVFGWASEERKPKDSFVWAFEEQKPKDSFGWASKEWKNPKIHASGWLPIFGKSGTKIYKSRVSWCLPKNGKNQRFVSSSGLPKNDQRFIYTNT
ncbi:unnamed protein product [Rhizophagus irregularis]|nr:unnamed protein product [Rhizophagus irregularis]